MPMGADLFQCGTFAEPFEEKMKKLTAQLKIQFEESERLEMEIKANLKALGF